MCLAEAIGVVMCFLLQFGRRRKKERKEIEIEKWNWDIVSRVVGVVFGIFWRLEERKVFMLLSAKWWINGCMAWCECFSGIYWEKCGGARNEKDEEKIKLKWECEEADIEYFGEAIVRFCWIDLKMKNKKDVGYVDFLKNKKVRKILWENIFKLRAGFFQLLIYFIYV